MGVAAWLRRELKGERTVSQLVELAGGLNTVAFKGRLQIERIVDNNRQVVFESDLEESKGKEVDLRSGDVLKVYQVVRDRRMVRITGAVQREGEFGFTPGMTVKDLVALSGGTKYYAYLKEAELTRLHVSDAGPKVEKRNVDLEKAIAGDPLANPPLQEDDQVFVRAVPEWRMYSQVAILGEFLFPGTYTVRKGEKLSSLIERAGGFSEKAYPRGAVFTRESVRELQQKRLMESIDRLERDLLARGSVGLSAAASPEELKAKGRLVVHGRHRPILLIYDRGRVFALDNRCPHMGFPLERGSIEDGILTCHWHHARFDPGLSPPWNPGCGNLYRLRADFVTSRFGYCARDIDHHPGRGRHRRLSYLPGVQLSTGRNGATLTESVCHQ